MTAFLFCFRFCIDPVTYDPFSDQDSLSYNSLSRSSSLIQFESLERQMQTGDNFGGSSPFLNILTTTQETHSKVEFNAPPVKSNENTNDTNSGRNYYDIEKIDFNSPLFLNCQEQTSSSESSYSTDNSIYYSDNQHDVEPVAKEKSQQTTHGAKMAFRNKNSVENLSEDSGYGEFPSIKCRSKSIPNLNQDQLIEEDEDLDNHRSLNNISKRNVVKRNGIIGEAHGSKINSTHAEQATVVRSTENTIAFGASKNSCRERDWSDEHVFIAPTNTNGVSSKRSASSTSMQNTQSASLPDISAHFASDYGNKTLNFPFIFTLSLITVSFDSIEPVCNFRNQEIVIEKVKIKPNLISFAFFVLAILQITTNRFTSATRPIRIENPNEIQFVVIY